MRKNNLPPFRAFKQLRLKQSFQFSSFIYQLGESPLLRQKSTPVNLKTLKFASQQKKIEYLKSCLLRYREITRQGRGITGVQVGIPERISVVFTPENELIVIINPVITKASNKKYRYPEMCMSAWPIIAPVIRPAWIEFEYFNEKGQQKFWNEKSDTDRGRMLNRVFQHEFDHLEGILNIDYCQGADLILESDPDFYQTAIFQEV